MAARAHGGWWRAPGRVGPFLLLALLALGPTALRAPAQAPAAETIYFPKSTFLIPFQVDANDRRVRNLLLHVSDDFGKTYRLVGTVAPTEQQFRFQAPRDGWYWFVVQTLDADNRYTPANVNLAQPGLKVCVDTQPPRATLRQAEVRGYAVGIEWDAQDDNLDLMSLRLDYRVAGTRDWLPLPIQQLAQGSHGWNPSANAQLEVRLQVRDKALNPFETTLTVNAAGRAGAPAGQAAPGDANRPGSVLMVNKRRIQLNFKIEEEGPSGISAVEIWATTDTRNWYQYKKETSKSPPYLVEVAGEGRYGFTLIARSGVGLSEPAPSPGDQPQIWVEVDETKPAVRLLGVEVGRGADTGNLTIRWTASDAHLAATPISISYATAADGTWSPIAQNLPNDGRYVWRMGQGVPYQFFVRVEAADQAGNLGHDDTRQAVKVDLTLPKARVLNVEPAPTMPASDPAPSRPAPESNATQGPPDPPRVRATPEPAAPTMNPVSPR